jgi:DNA processing protein
VSIARDHILLHLSLIDGVGPAAVQAIIEHKPLSFDWSDLYQLSVYDWMQCFGCSEKAAHTLVDGLKDSTLLDAELRLIDRYNLLWTTILSDEYPSLLKHIHNPPTILYWQGSLSCLNNHTLAIVGSRKANFYAQDIIDMVVSPLVAQGWTIVSGGALGADSMAHNAVLKAGGVTVAVLGSGLLHKYPASNSRMFDALVAQGGALVSSFPVDTQAYPHNFPIRNRIVSGLSKGCLVVQAAAKSGARITAQCALDQGRDVFAVPGSIKDPLSAGCHDLIAQGAKLVTCVDDILSEYALNHMAPRHYVQQTILDSTQQIAAHNSPAARIIAACVRPQSVEDLLVHTHNNLSELQTILFELQLEGKIKQDFAGMWTI